ncbi:DUF3793 family protein [Lachnoclostridium edouardi]|uniref:DUF3793 family protein n=1 Tax=Lachnoclostridium edouardi TaxID=1926283 RepID=UPI0015E121D1|nr:DUF3793 family protein [Lachnoclostridium edouardi]
MEAHLVRYGAPTLVGLKSGSLFRLPLTDMPLAPVLLEENRRLRPKGLTLTAVRRESRAALVLLYRRRVLERELRCPEAMSLLTLLGYPKGGVDLCLEELLRRLAPGRGFPHEIGLFLGYPPEDVAGFLQNSGRGSRYVGCWKVYGDVEAACRRFSQIRQCTELCWSQYCQGMRPEQMARP